MWPVSLPLAGPMTSGSFRNFSDALFLYPKMSAIVCYLPHRFAKSIILLTIIYNSLSLTFGKHSFYNWCISKKYFVLFPLPNKPLIENVDQGWVVCPAATWHVLLCPLPSPWKSSWSDRMSSWPVRHQMSCSNLLPSWRTERSSWRTGWDGHSHTLDRVGFAQVSWTSFSAGLCQTLLPSVSMQAGGRIF